MLKILKNKLESAKILYTVNKFDKMTNFSEQRLKKITFRDLAIFKTYTQQYDESPDRFINFSLRLWNANVSRISKKQQIEVLFLVNYSNTYCYDGLYRLMKDSPIFNPRLVVAMNADFINGGWLVDDYKRTLADMKKLYGEECIETFNFDENRQYTWEELGLNPDIICHLTPHEFLRDDYLFYNIPISTLNIYVPYGYPVAMNKSGNFTDVQYNLYLHLICWKFYAPVRSDIELSKKYSYINGINVVFSGYPKMDRYFSTDEPLSSTSCWKDSVNSTKHIIYAPHHSIRDVGGIALGTFDLNKDYMLNLARQHQEISWVIRPHYLLGVWAVKHGVFNDIEEYNEYLAEWNKLPNARLSQEGDYYELFKTSDALIMDCGSFIAEYLFVDKPCLYLLNPNARFSEFGQRCIDSYSTANGDDYKTISNFVEDVLNENDKNKENRMDVFSEYLDYYSFNGMTASEFIFNDLLKSLGKD